MTARDELARDIFLADNVNAPAGLMEAEWDGNWGDETYAHMIADGLIAKGYRKPWTITTATERVLLQPGTICMDGNGNAWKRGTGSWVSTGGDTGPLYDEDDITLTVLHEGNQP